VQLLARNLGIPNVVVGNERVPAVKARAGSLVVLAVSPGGVVQLAESGPRFDGLFGKQQPEERIVIRADLEKLDLSQTDFVPLARLRTADSGRVSGPKGANLGELRAVFGEQVPDGFVIPFGAFRKVLDQPLEPGGPSAFEWMQQEYRTIETLSPRPQEQTRAISDFLARLRAWIERVDPGPEFRERLAKTLADRFGKEGTYGVFVRSDTNVEDLPGFTGAGLNLTVSNVVGTEQVLEAIRRVWASPFTERAYGWRQSHMEEPEYVFPAVVVQRSFPSEKSGVMVSTDVGGGEPGWITVAVNEGVSGAVDGQAAESLLVSTQTGEVRLLAQATSPLRNVLSPGGGVAEEPASGAEQLLDPGEIAQLVELAKQLPTRVATLRGQNGETLPADVEFAFRGGRLTLLQIRPFVESRAAQRNEYLLSLDAGARERVSRKLRLDAPLGGGAP
jgi:phosphoenolpyruvate synthase/pyruvate phosphate dikinase